MKAANPQNTNPATSAPAVPQTQNDPGGKQSIFAMTFEKQKRGQEAIKKQNMKKGSIFLAIAILILIPYSIIFLYPQVTSYLAFGSELRGYQEQVSDLEIKIDDLKKERDGHKAAYDEENKIEQGVIDAVFPDTPEKLEVVRLMEDYATYLSNTFGDFEFTSINFQEPVKQEGYTVLPFQTSIHASQKNFDRFLAFVDFSGDIDPDSLDHILLMEISNITLRYRGPDKTGKDQGVDFDVQLNAYSK